MDDDDRLLDALGRALVPPAEPPSGRLSAFLAGIGGERRQCRVPPPKLGWLAAGISVVAAMTVLLVLALPTVVSPKGSSQAEAAVARLRTALAGGDPIAVAEADAALLRVASRLADREAEQVRGEALSAHTRAVVFLRDNPSPIELAPRPVEGATAAAAPGPAPGPAPTVAAGPEPGITPTTTAILTPVGRRVDIVAVTADLDGSFRVDFTTTGFMPAPGRAPGTYAVRFSFDDGRAPSTWTSSSPWVFPLNDGLLYRRVCAEVVDHNGVAVPSSGNCRPIG